MLSFFFYDFYVNFSSACDCLKLGIIPYIDKAAHGNFSKRAGNDI